MFRWLQKHRKGVTLLETVLSISIFVVVSMQVTDIFLTATRANRRVEARAVVEQELRRWSDEIARELRTGEIDYDRYLGPEYGQAPDADGVEMLYVWGRAGEQVHFYKRDDGTLMIERIEDILSPEEYQALSHRVVITQLQFLIYPFDNPFEITGGAYLSNAQPRVTIVASGKLREPLKDEDGAVQFQTTLTSRVLRR
ncbi:MAG: hypothetical protein HOJ15_00540 [Candidatus Jacksonbacteria bacterium]|jgi:hypothetical protein|nr:hypothetical protein [Candidatus Jacksonbacteria bacterium]MBT6300901.1 hypothetical protein [Candidatus Jacksonbacteria bacterium]MBT6757278.1 hypothetical protein [Candidatus Jacksonbacteria bacterium]MBT6955383.1 hypothetical protein [Candidatus Jacksonbacteria bacterium]MBT7007909.1 hypothetical protein [Candidatus Jacksonbacteria bacterium]